MQLVSLKNGNGLKVDESSGEVIIDEETEEMSEFRFEFFHRFYFYCGKCYSMKDTL